MEQSYNGILPHLLELMECAIQSESFERRSFGFENPDKPQKSEGAEFIIDFVLNLYLSLYI